RIEKDPRARRLALLEGVRSAVAEAVLPETLLTDAETYGAAAEAFKQNERTATDLLLIGLYDRGKSVLQGRVIEGGSATICPLCGKDFGADLLVHLEGELATLNELKNARDSLDLVRKQLAGALRGI